MENHLRKKLNSLKRKFKQFTPKTDAKWHGVVSNSSSNYIAVADTKNIAAAVNTWQSDSSQMALSNQATHINQEIS